MPVAKPAPPIAYPVSRSTPVDLFAQALSSTTPSRTISNEPPELPTIRTLARFGLMIAKADGQVANAERIAVREFLTRLFGHNSILVRHIDPIMEAAEKAIPTEAAAIAEVVRCTPPDKRLAVYQAAEKIADACGTRNPYEIDTLQRVAIAFGMIPPTATIEPSPKFANIFNVPTRPEPEAVRVAEAPSQSIPRIVVPELHVIQTLARFGMMIAKADGFIGDDERNGVRLFLTTLFGQNPILAQQIDAIMYAAERTVPKEAVAIAEVITCTFPERRRAIYYAAEKIADAWAPRSRSEIETLKRVAIAFDAVPTLPKPEAVKPAPEVPPQTIAPIELPELQSIPILARFGLMIAKADGFIGDPERNAVRLFLTALFGDEPMLARRIETTLQAAERAVPKEAVAIAEVIACTSPERRRAIYLAAEKIADAWLPRNKSEVETLKRVGIAFDVVPAAPSVEMSRPVSSIFTMPTPPIPEGIRRVAEAPPPQRASPPKSLFAVRDPRKLLEIDPNTKLSVELIRRRFAVLSERINPKKAAAFGPEFVELATKNLAELRAAAEMLLSSFGVSLDITVPPPPTDMRHNPDLDDVFG